MGNANIPVEKQQCHPISSYWDPISTACFDPTISLFLHRLTNIVTDIYIYILPIQLVWKVQLPKRQRIALLVIFGVGFLVCIFGALRPYYTIITDKSPDTPWEGFYLWTLESLEINLGIVCASAPSLKALVTRMMPRLFPSSVSRIKSVFATFETDRSRSGRDAERGSTSFVMTTITGGAVGEGESEVNLTGDGKEERKIGEDAV